MALSPAELGSLCRRLDEALELGPLERRAWLAKMQQDDLGTLLVQVLEAEADGSEDPRLVLPAIPLHELGPCAGDLVGPYRLLREIGRGGMGTVWLAARADGSFEREIALKLPRLSWMDGLVERMARERRIGALLEHPGIARMYDAGVTAGGLPYIAMEYIDGQAIDAWCTVRALGLRDRLRLFLPVVRAIAYAHGRLVIHRDLKPANILVDIQGGIHLLDFGIARLADEAGIDLTQDLGRAFTPSYAAPEQIAGEPVGVAADVYSLGVLLCELLTGKLPYVVKRPTAGAVEQAILQRDPLLASSRADDRQTARELRGDLDAIIAKALKAVPAERYPTADALADDIERFLDGKTICARADGFWYRTRKAAGRHRRLVAASCAVVFVALIGGTSFLIQWRQAAQQAERVKLATDFVSELFRASVRAGSTSASSPPPAAPDSMLDQGARLILERFPGQPDLQADLYGVVGRIYADIGAAQTALDYGRRQLALLEDIHAGTDRRVGAFMLLADASAQDDRDADAADYAERAAREVTPDDPAWVQAQIVRADILFRTFKRQAALEVATKAEQALLRQATPSRSDAARLAYLKAQVADDFAGRERALARAVQAEGLQSTTSLDLGIKLALEAASHGHVEAARKAADLVLGVLHSRGGSDEIRAAVFEAEYLKSLLTAGAASRNLVVGTIERCRERVAASTSLVPAVVVAKLDLALAELDIDWGEYGRVQSLLDRAAPTLLSATQSRALRLEVLTTQAILAMATGRHDEAGRLFDQTLTLFTLDQSPASDWYAFRLRVVARNLTMAGQFDRAHRLLSSAPAFGRRDGSFLGEAIPRFIPNESTRLALAEGDLEGAVRALAPLPAAAGPDTDPWYPERALHGEVDCAVGREAAGLAALLESIRTLSALVSENEPNLARLRAVAGLCALARGDRPLARALGDASRAAFTAQRGVSVYFRIPLMKLETALGERPLRISGWR